MALERVEMVRPQAPVGREPGVKLAQRARVDAVDPALSGGAARDEAGVTQDPEVLGHRRLADAERVDELTDTAFRRADPVDDAAPGRLRENRDGVRGHGAKYSVRGICVSRHTHCDAR